MSRNPRILDGTRGPKADRIDDMRARSEALPDPLAGQAGRPEVDGTVYLSPFGSYRVQITAQPDVTDPITGRKTIGRPTAAVFQDGRYVNNARDPKLRAYIDEVLQQNKRFGRPGSGADYWLATDARRMAQAAAKASATATLRQLARENPAELSQLIAELKQGDAADITMPTAPVGPAA
jgi:hypothetical protein